MLVVNRVLGPERVDRGLDRREITRGFAVATVRRRVARGCDLSR
jgi:hypothetical protein